MDIIVGGKPTTRKMRNPSFPVNGTMRPFGLYPVMYHPVLPGETLQSASFKMNHISMPLKNPFGGSWLESWLVYVKLTDIDQDLGQSFLTDTMATTGYTATADDERFFVKSGQINWLQLAVEKFHAHYFKHETEPAEVIQRIDGVPKVKLNNTSWYQNMMFKPADAAVPTTDASDQYEHLQQWQILTQMNLIEMTYEKYVEQFGGSVPQASQGAPEVLAFKRSWTLPTNVIDPADGSPSSAWVWKDQFTVDKPKKFTEPGFVIMCQCVRPKMYIDGIRTSLIGNMWGFNDWYPIYNLEDPTAGIKEIETDDVMFEAGTRVDVGEKTMIYDHRDLLNHGEQFVNNWSTPQYPVPVSTGVNLDDAADPEDLRGEYISTSDSTALFTTAAANVVNYDGAGFLSIRGHVTETSPM